MNHTHRLLLAFVATSSATAGCGGSSSGDSGSDLFVVRSTNVSTYGATPIRVSGAYLAFLADEATTGMGGTDLNGDGGSPVDTVAHVVNTSANTQFRLGVAADDLAWAGSELYLVVDETRDGRDWNDDVLLDDDVLLHWSQSANMLERVDDLATDAALSVLGLGSRIVYAAKVATPGMGGSNLRFVESTDPLVPIPVGTTDTGLTELTLRLLGEDSGLIFLAFDETTAARDLNGDADTLDANVLGLLSGTVSTSVARCTELAVDPASPRRAKTIATGDWRVGFLVSEAGQDGLSLNSSALGPNFRPAQCADDMDATDDVLAVLTFGAWMLDPAANPPVNHGLAGRDRIAFAGNYVATIVSEVQDNCNLNGPMTPLPDLDSTDLVVRWVAIANGPLDPILPINDANQIRALADVPGGGHGLYELSNRFVIVASEEDGGNIDTDDMLDANLLGWLMPSTSSTIWDFYHGQDDTQVVEASWLSPRESESRLGVAFTERVGVMPHSLNPGTVQNPGDTDTLDAIPTFATFGSGRMVFPGVGIALDKDSAGMVTAKGWTFYRVSELEDSRDTNNDGDEMDFILEVTDYSVGTTFGLSVANSLDRDVVDVARFGSIQCAAFLATEAQQGVGGTDFDTDGDRTDLVLRWFRY
jgi:hypothetical protein